MKKINVTLTMTQEQNNFIKKEALNMGISKSAYVQLLIIESMKRKGLENGRII